MYKEWNWLIDWLLVLQADMAEEIMVSATSKGHLAEHKMAVHEKLVCSN